MKSTLRTLVRATAVVALLGSAAYVAVPSFAAEMTVEVGGAPMYPSKNIVENAVNSKDHTTLVAAVKAAGLVETLMGAGPFTVFAPVNAAFEKLPAGTVDTLLKPENKGKLVAVLTYHVVPGKHSAADIMADIKKMGGKATYKTVEGDRPDLLDEGRHAVGVGRLRRQGEGHHRRRQPVERRHPRHRHGPHPEGVSPATSTGAVPPAPGSSSAIGLPRTVAEEE